MYVHTFLQYNVIRSSIKRGIRLYDFELTFSYEIVFPFSQQNIKKSYVVLKRFADQYTMF